MRVRGFITGIARGDVCSGARDESVCVWKYARATSRVRVHGGYTWAQRGGRALGDPFFSVSPVLSSLPFYARALLC